MPPFPHGPLQSLDPRSPWNDELAVLADVGKELVAECDGPLEVAGLQRSTDPPLPAVPVECVVHPRDAAVVEPEVMIAATGVDANRQVSDRHGCLSVVAVSFFVRNVPDDASSEPFSGSGPTLAARQRPRG